ncbi:MAG: LysR family transcriptional regulator [Myxococcota bacterium]
MSLQVGQMVLFAKVVEAGSFAAAAKSLGQTRAAVSKQIASLEERIGAQLLQRTTRSMHLTESGKEFHARCARIAEEAAEAERAVASLQAAPRGELRIAAPVTFGRRYLAPLMASFLDAHPEIQVELSLSDAEPDLSDEGFDVAVRIGPRAESGQVAKLLAESPHVLCASPGYWERHGVPSAPEDLRGHECLLYSSLPTPRVWRFARGKRVRVSGRFSVDHGESLRQAALDGVGVAYMPEFLVGRDLAEGRLVSALDDWCLSRMKVWALYPRSRNLAPKVRVFVEFLADHFHPQPPWRVGRARASAA